jgi:DNA-binding CsgD family transcriptional regulator
MHRLPIDNQISEADLLLRASKELLLDDKPWSYLQRLYCLTPRELQVARLICSGLDNNKIAAVLNIRYGTVKVHLRSVYRKVRVNTKVSLLLRFIDDVVKRSGVHQADYRVAVDESS